jgi:hypothetical protein
MPQCKSSRTREEGRLKKSRKVFQSGLTAPPLDHAAIAQAMLHAKARVCASPVVATTTAVTPNGKDHSRSLVHEVIRKILMAVSQAILAGRNSGLIDQGHNPQWLWDMGPPVLRKRPSLHRKRRSQATALRSCFL